MCWADIMQLDYPEVGQSVQEWADGLLGRLSRKNEWAENNPGKGAEVPQWVLKTLELLIETLVLDGEGDGFPIQGNERFDLYKISGRCSTIRGIQPMPGPGSATVS
jgi:hypothetical protein